MQVKALQITLRLVIFFLFSFSFESKATSPDIQLSYTISPISTKHGAELKVSLRFEAPGEQSTLLILPSIWAGQTKLYHEVVKLECTSSHAWIEDTEKPFIKRLHHSPGQNIDLAYRIRSIRAKNLDWYYRPVIEKDHFLIFGHCLFITPHLGADPLAEIKLEWKHIPDSWNIMNSFGTNRHKQKLAIPLATLQHAVFAGGDFTLISCGKKDAPITVAVQGRWSFSMDRFIKTLESIIKGQRRFWKDNNYPFYLVTVMNSKSDQYIAGTAVNHAFSIFISDFQNESRENWKAVEWLLSHEHFHTWNGLKFKPAATEGSTLWFTEGFTEYYALELLHRFGMWSKKDYFDSINGILSEYYTSPARNIKNRQIDNNFWSNRHVQRIPYLRGFIIAMMWDLQIKKRTKGSHSLDTVMQGLFRNISKSGSTWNLLDVKKIAGKYAGRDFVDSTLDHYIINGLTIPLEEKLFEDIAIIHWIEQKENQNEGKREFIPRLIPYRKAGGIAA